MPPALCRAAGEALGAVRGTSLADAIVMASAALRGGGVVYTVSDETPYGLRLTSDAFRGYKSDRWFFTKANFAARADERVQCLSAYSY